MDVCLAKNGSFLIVGGSVGCRELSARARGTFRVQGAKKSWLRGQSSGLASLGLQINSVGAGVSGESGWRSYVQISLTSLRTSSCHDMLMHVLHAHASTPNMHDPNSRSGHDSRELDFPGAEMGVLSAGASMKTTCWLAAGGIELATVWAGLAMVDLHGGVSGSSSKRACFFMFSSFCLAASSCLSETYYCCRSLKFHECMAANHIPSNFDGIQGGDVLLLGLLSQEGCPTKKAFTRPSL